MIRFMSDTVSEQCTVGAGPVVIVLILVATKKHIWAEKMVSIGQRSLNPWIGYDQMEEEL